MTNHAIIYTRFSPRPNAGECDSCEKQAERCLDYCRARKIGISGTFEDRAVSGSDFDRPALAEAIGSLSAGDILVVDSSDRLARDMLVYYAIMEKVQAAGAKVEYANGQPCEDTPEGKFIQGMFALIAALERDRIKLRCKLGHKRRRENGKRTTGKIPIGWELDPDDPKRLVVCRQERLAIIQACTFARKGKISDWIADELTDFLGPCRGKPWSASTIRKLIKRHAFWADPVDGNPALEPKHP